MGWFHFRSLNEVDPTEGTVTLVKMDSNRRLNLKGDGKHDGIVLIPQPTNDVNDPLNWPKWKKVVALFTIAFYSAISEWQITGVSNAIVLIQKKFNSNLNQTSTGLITWCIFALGIGNFIFVPAANYFGRRPVFVLTSFGVFLTQIWSAKATSLSSMIASKVIAALFSATGQALAEAVVADLFFLHERGQWMGVIVLFMSSGSVITIGSGFLITAKGYVWLFWFAAIILGAAALGVFFLYPETRYERDVTASIAGLAENASESDVPTPEEPKDISTEDVRDAHSPPPQKKKTYLQELNPISPLNTKYNYFQLLFRPWPLVVYPAVIYTFFIYAMNLAWGTVILNTQANLYQKPPYNMTPGINSLMKIPFVIGVIIGTTIGPITDKYVEWKARRRNGVYEPEWRLVFLIIPYIVTPIGVLMYGLAAPRQLSWAVGWVGYGLLGYGLGSISTIMSVYLVDSYFAVAPEVLMLANGLKQIFAFGFSYAAIPWITQDGWDGTFGAIAGIQVGIMAFGLPLWYFGKRIRHASANWKVISW